MQFRVLGPLEVEHDGRAVDLGRPKQRALLAILLIHANHLVPADRIVEDLWPGDLPADPSAALQVQVSRLRQVLAGCGCDAQAVLESRRPGYVLHLADGDLDAARFERLVEEGRRAVADGRVEEGAARLAAGLALWRGGVLDDFAGEPFALGEAARLEELRAAAAEDWVDAELRLGHHATVVGEIRRLADANPLRERPWAQLMLALYRSDRQAEALRAYGELRHNLAEELGIDPSPALQRLEEMVLLQKVELDWHPAEDAPPAPADGDRGVADAAVDAVRGVGTVHRPSVADDRDGLPFVGRQAELDVVGEAWRAALASGPGLVLLAGEPGIGKSRLAMEHARRAHEEGAGVLLGRCDEDLAVPYQPFAEAMERAVRQLHPAELAGLLGRRGGELVRLLPDLADLAPAVAAPWSSDPETERFRLFDAVGRALATLSRHAPLVLVLDDLHWATAPTLLLLRHLVTRLEPMPVLVVGTYRHTEVDDRHPLAEVLGEAGRLPNVTRIVLGGLDEEAVHGFVRAVVGPGVSDVERDLLARSVHSGTAGNPLFMREMVRHVEESGHPGDDVPEGVRDVVRRRLLRLSESTNRLLVVASVIGAEYDLDVLQGAVGLDEEAVLSGLEEAVRAGLVADAVGPGLRQRFTHALVRATLYDGLTAPRRAQLHRRVAESVELLRAGRTSDHLAELAHHFTRAAAIGGAAKAVAYSTLAGEKALGQLAHDDAAGYFQQALDLLDLVPPSSRGADDGGAVDRIRQRCDILLALGEAQRRCGAPAHRQTLLDAADLAREMGDAERLASAALANTRSFWSATRRVDAERVAAFRDALAALDGGDSPLRARLLARLAVELVYSGDAVAVRRLSDEALAMARRLGDLPTLAQVLVPRYNTIRGDPGTLGERLSDTAELLDVATRLTDPSLRCEAYGWRAVAAMEAAQAEEAATCLDAFERMAAAVHQPAMLWYVAYMRASRAMLEGRFDDAERLANEAFRLGRSAGQPDADLFLSAQRLQLAFERGVLGRWERPLRVALTRDPDSWWFLRSWQALCDTERDDDEGARAHLDELAANEFADLTFEPTWLHIVANCAAVAAHLGDTARAGRLYELMSPYAGQLVTLSSLAYCGSVDHYLGLLAAALGRHQEAASHYQAAAILHRQVGAPAWLARTRLAQALSLTATGRPVEAVPLLQGAAATAGRLGMASVARRVLPAQAAVGTAALARGVPGTDPLVGAPHPSGLSPG